uniref:Rhomboid-like protein n=1 Tax=Anopheles christyi TaxID=43041 RepID=A0A182JVE6_9DIPT
RECLELANSSEVEKLVASFGIGKVESHPRKDIVGKLLFTHIPIVNIRSSCWSIFYSIDSLFKMDRGEQHIQVIPLHRLNTREENQRRQHLRHVFEKYDTDSDGFLNVVEMKHLINEKKCPELPKDLASHLLKISDTNNDGRLDFDEFYKLSTEHPLFLFEMCIKYCKAVVPKRNDDEEGDVLDGEYEQSMKLWPPPLMMIIFSILEVIFFVIDIIKTQEQNGTSTNGPMATLFIYNPHLRHEVWRFLTYMFVHIGFMHLIMNLLVQIFLGVALELVHCWWRVALVYLAGVVAGSMGTSLFTPRVFLAGASGGVYALITAHIATIIMVLPRTCHNLAPCGYD